MTNRRLLVFYWLGSVSAFVKLGNSKVMLPLLFSQYDLDLYPRQKLCAEAVMRTGMIRDISRLHRLFVSSAWFIVQSTADRVYLISGLILVH